MKKKSRFNKRMFIIGMIILLITFVPVYSYDTSCCGHNFRQDMSVSNFITGIPSCTGWGYSDFLYPAWFFTAIIFGIGYLIGSMALKG